MGYQKFYPKTREQIEKVLAGGRDPNSRQISFSCYAEKRPGDVLAIRQHATDIITHNPDGTVVLDTGGWRTVTTKARLNDFIPFGGIYAGKGEWYFQLGGWGEEGETFIFKEGMILHPDGTVTGAANKQEAKNREKLRKKANAYAKKFADALLSGRVEAPGAGDCFFCVIRGVETGKPLGELWEKGNSGKEGQKAPHSHIREHIEENYFVPSLAWRAFERYDGAPLVMTALGAAMGMPGAGEFGSYFRGLVEWRAARNIRRYVLSEMGFSV